MKVTWDIVGYTKEPGECEGTDGQCYVVNASVISLWIEEPMAVLVAEPYTRDRWIISPRYAD